MADTIKQDGDFLFQLDEFYLDLRSDGRSISFLDKEQIQQRPFPGLRPFKTSEFQLFNGRDGQAEELINRLRKNHFLAVIGSSGTGKSSLIRAGLIPQLLAGYLHEAGTNWNIAVCRPGKDPLENLAVALARVKCRSNNNEAINQEYKNIKPLISRSIYGILEFDETLDVSEKAVGEKSNLLIVVDQFEELFRFNRNDLGDPNIENHFINLLLKASGNPDVSIYVIVTMRSEFLGDCAKFRGLPEAINEGQYLVPQLSREQIKEIIEDPITIAGKKIAPGLVELLVNEIEESKVRKDLDQLPILQHALMRTYQAAMKRNAKEVTYEDYVTTGGLKDALANHAQSRFDELGNKSGTESFKQKIARVIFQALTDGSTDNKKGRRPTELSILYDIALSIKATPQEVNEVIDHFRDVETSFIMPPSNTPLYPKLITDISHESLMRQWGKLEEWISQESENGKILQRLAENANFNKQGQKDLLSGKELKLFSNWYKNFNPGNSWSKRYSDTYNESYDYLKRSIKRNSLKRQMLAVFAVIVLFLLIYSGFYFINTYQNYKTKIALLLDKRTVAFHSENKLQALLLTTDILLIGKDNALKDSLISQSIKWHLNPAYALKDVFLFSDKVNYAYIEPDGNSFFILKNDKSFAKINTYSGKELSSGQYSVIRDEEVLPDLVKIKYLKLIYTSPKQYTQDTILTDSSDYFKRHYLDDMTEKDDFGIYSFPNIVKNINGVYQHISKRVKPAWLTWGDNTESNFNAVDIWDKNGISAGVSLIHDGIYGASFTQDNNMILSWGSDSVVKVWQLVNDTGMMRLPAKLLKSKVEVESGVELDKNNNEIKLIAYPDYFKRKEAYLQAYEAYMKSGKNN
jgi:hypothetical protein